MSNDINYIEITAESKKCVVTPSQPHAVDVVHVTSLIQIAIVVVAITFVFMELCCQQNYFHEYIMYSTCLPQGRS